MLGSRSSGDARPSAPGFVEAGAESPTQPIIRRVGVCWTIDLEWDHVVGYMFKSAQEKRVMHSAGQDIYSIRMDLRAVGDWDGDFDVRSTELHFSSCRNGNWDIRCPVLDYNNDGVIAIEDIEAFIVDHVCVLCTGQLCECHGPCLTDCNESFASGGDEPLSELTASLDEGCELAASFLSVVPASQAYALRNALTAEFQQEAFPSDYA
jgi:hypothetical protein